MADGDGDGATAPAASTVHGTPSQLATQAAVRAVKQGIAGARGGGAVALLL